jgi:hypothetical protein
MNFNGRTEFQKRRIERHDPAQTTGGHLDGGSRRKRDDDEKLI